MKPINIFTSLLLLGIVVILCVILYRMDRKEHYCVDISGGFKPPCDCTGYCEK